MIKPIKFSRILFCLFAIALNIWGQNSVPAVKASAEMQASLTAEEIIAKYIEKIGGLKKILSIRTLIYSSESIDEDGEKSSFSMTRARPYYFLVGHPQEMQNAGYAEGNDGSHWEFFRDPGLVLRTTGAPASAIRHTAYFDDALVLSAREPGFKVKLIGKEMIAKNDAYKIQVIYPDGFETYIFVDTQTWLIAARRFTAPVHAFGQSITSETRYFEWKRVSGVLYPFALHEVEIATNKTLNESRWNTIVANVEIRPDAFSPPAYEQTPLNRMLNSAYAARNIPVNSLGWYRDFRVNPENVGIDTSLGMSSIGYQILKTGAVETAILLLEENVKDYPNVAHAQFGLGRAYMTAGRKKEAIAAFQNALKIDPKYQRASDALEQALKD